MGHAQSSPEVIPPILTDEKSSKPYRCPPARSGGVGGGGQPRRSRRRPPRRLDAFRPPPHACTHTRGHCEHWDHSRSRTHIVV